MLYAIEYTRYATQDVALVQLKLLSEDALRQILTLRANERATTIMECDIKKAAEWCFPSAVIIPFETQEDVRAYFSGKEIVSYTCSCHNGTNPAELEERIIALLDQQGPINESILMDLKLSKEGEPNESDISEQEPVQESVQEQWAGESEPTVESSESELPADSPATEPSDDSGREGA